MLRRAFLFLPEYVAGILFRRRRTFTRVLGISALSQFLLVLARDYEEWLTNTLVLTRSSSSQMLSIGALIWISIRPLLRLILCTSCGFIITRADIFPLVAARGTGHILLNITLPALMFSRIVPAFTSDNIGALGPLILIGFIYEALGLAIAWLVKQFFWVPHRFRYGILVAGGWSNVGDVPTAVIMSITSSAPFNPSHDQTVAIAYVSAFILVYFITLFPMGGHRLIAWDYVGPEVDDDELRMGVPAKTRESVRQWARGLSAARRRILDGDANDLMDADAQEKQRDDDNIGKYEKDIGEDCRRVEFASKTDCIETSVDCEAGACHSKPQASQTTSCHPQKRVSFYAGAEVDDGKTAVPTERLPSGVCSPAHTANDGPSCLATPIQSVTHVDTESALNPVRGGSCHAHSSCNCRQASKDTTSAIPQTVGPSITVQPRSRALRHRIVAQARTILLSLCNPQAITIFVSLLIALVSPLKALFTPIDNSPIPNAPDGQPPLAFILDTASFIGAASVPMGLICLGSALARLRIPRSQWGSLPLGAIGSLAIGKMVLMPVLGVLIVQGMTMAGLIDRNDKALRFVCIFLSCIPTATTQVFLTQVYSGTGEAGTLSAFLIPQYALMFITMTVLTAYTLSLLF